MVAIDINKILPTLPNDEPDHGGCGRCGSGEAGERCGNGLEKIYPTTAVRFGYMKHIGEFSHAPSMKFTCGAKVVVQTHRGQEIGQQVSLTCTGCDKSVSREQIRAYAEASGGDTVLFDAGRIVREATMADLSEYARLQAEVSGRRRFCQQMADAFDLPMKIVECEILFGGERVLFYFKAEGRIDFRQLVRTLSSEFQTRIEMRQIGARDEARLLADFETCGREVCCKTFLKSLKPVSMKMAKLQKATIDPTKVSGRCGRLKCCLRYEHASYEELDRSLPKTGVRVLTEHGEGVIIKRQILTQLVQIRTDDGKIVAVAVEDIIKRLPRNAPATEGGNQPAPTLEDRPAAGAGGQRGPRPASRNRAGPRGRSDRRSPRQPRARSTEPKDGRQGSPPGDRERYNQVERAEPDGGAAPSQEGKPVGDAQPGDAQPGTPSPSSRADAPEGGDRTTGRPPRRRRKWRQRGRKPGDGGGAGG